VKKRTGLGYFFTSARLRALRLPVRASLTRTGGGHCFIVFFAALLSFLTAAPALAQGPTEPQVKVAFLYKFAHFIKWPERVSGRFNICVHGKDPFGPAWNLIKGKTVGGGHVVTGPCPRPDCSDCRIVFISRSMAGRLSRELAGVRRPGVLTVSDIPGFAKAGGVIEIFIEGGKLRFAINVAAAKRAGLTISSRLLRLARIVGGAP